VLLGSGILYGELARLKPEDVLPAHVTTPGYLTIRPHARREGRKVPVSDRTIASAQRLLELGGVPDDNGSQMHHRLEDACAAAGVPSYTSRHLRDTYGVTCLRNGMDIRTLQVRMGHTGIATALKYQTALRAELGDEGFAPCD
jgi:integrase